MRWFGAALTQMSTACDSLGVIRWSEGSRAQQSELKTKSISFERAKWRRIHRRVTIAYAITNLSWRILWKISKSGSSENIYCFERDSNWNLACWVQSLCVAQKNSKKKKTWKHLKLLKIYKISERNLKDSRPRNK